MALPCSHVSSRLGAVIVLVVSGGAHAFTTSQPTRALVAEPETALSSVKQLASDSTRWGEHDDSGHHIIASGMNPPSDSGADPNDPLLFKHRFQHHNPDTNELLYFQYEAKRHAHVQLLGGEDVRRCRARAHPSGDTSTEVDLTISRASHARIKPDNVVVLADGCNSHTNDKEPLQGKVVASSVVRCVHSRRMR